MGEGEGRGKKRGRGKGMEEAGWMYGSMDVWMYGPIDASRCSMDVRMYGCVYVIMDVWMCGCMDRGAPWSIVSIGIAELWGGRVGGERWLKQRTCDFAGGKKEW